MPTLTDFRQALLSLRRARAYYATVVVTLGLALGGLILVYTLNYQVLLAPLPYPDAEKLVVAKGQVLKHGRLEMDETFAYPALMQLYQQQSGQAGSSATALQSYNTELVQNLPEKPTLAASYVTPDYANLLAIPMQLGRFFSANEGLGSAEAVAVLSYHSWQRHFNGQPDIVGRTLIIQDKAFQIIGVTAQDFHEPKLMAADQNTTALWLPFDFNHISAADRQLWTRTYSGLYLLTRLTNEAQSQALAAQWSDGINQHFQQESAALPMASQFALKVELVRLKEKLNSDSPQLTVLLLLAVLALAGVALSNISHLMLARGAKLQPQLAIAAAVGASKQQLSGRLLAEQCLLLGAALFVALIAASLALPMVRDALSPYIGRAQELQLWGHSIVFTLLIALLLAWLFTLLIRRHCDYHRLITSLASGAKGGAFQGASRRAGFLLCIQACLAGLLLIASAQVWLQAVRHLHQPLGFSSEYRYVLDLHHGDRVHASSAERLQDLLAIQQLLQQQAVIENVSLTTASPIHRYGDDQWQTNVSLNADFSQVRRTSGALIDQHYLPLLQIPVLAGRQFNNDEMRSHARSVLINQTLASRLFPQQPLVDVIGKSLYWLNSSDKTQPYQIIGVVADLSIPGSAESGRLLIPEWNPSRTVLLLSIKAGHSLNAAEMNQWLSQINEEYAVTSLLSMDQARQQLMANDSISALVTAALSLLVLLLVGIGIFGILSYQIQLRHNELGIRMAVGASPMQLLVQVSQENMRPVAAGSLLALLLFTLLYLLLPAQTIVPQLTIHLLVLPLTIVLLLTCVTCSVVLIPLMRKPVTYALRG